MIEQITNQPKVCHTSINGLRGLAVFLVFLVHCYPIPGIETGHLGVRIFFVLSGFFITQSLINQFEQNGVSGTEVRRFFINRATRILPVYGLVLLVGFFFSFEPLMQLMGWHLGMLTNIRVIFDGSAPYPTAHLWAVSLFVHFYLLWPLVIWIGGRKWALRFALCMVLGAPIFRFFWLLLSDYPLGARLLLPGVADTLGAGALLALAGESSRLRQILTSKLAAVSGILMVIAVSIVKAMTPSGSWGQVLYLILFDIGIWLMIVPLLHALLKGESIVSRLFSLQPIVFLGTISYGFYLIHPFVYYQLQNVSGLSPFLMALMTLLGTCVLGALSWFMIERPVLHSARP